MAFTSILFDREPGVDTSPPDRAPAFFGDLHLDQILASLTDGREEYDLAPFFYRPLHSVESVRYRHHVLRELERDDVIAAVRAFADGMTQMRKHLALVDKLHYVRQQQRWFLSAGSVYCSVVTGLAHALAALELESPGFRSLRDYLASYTASDPFTSLAAETQEREAELAAITYEVHIRGNRVTVSEYGGDAGCQRGGRARLRKVPAGRRERSSGALS